jgi:hypothetical protein
VVRFRGSGNSRGSWRLTALAPFTVTTAPSERTTFFKAPASTSCCRVQTNKASHALEYVLANVEIHKSMQRKL